MKNTCLFPFYEYIFKQWIGNENKLPEYDEIFCTFAEHKFEELDEVTIDKRKREIWNSTKKLFELQDEEERCRYIETLKNKNIKCDLCMKCISCETSYWKEVEKVIRKNEDQLAPRSVLSLPEQVKKLLENKERPVDMYIDTHIRRYSQERNCLIMLKGFSSSTPILLNYAGKEDYYSGGGFYIRWNKLGIAVDPGYLFVQNLHKLGYSVLDIDIVIVTHEHIDHSSDIRLLDDLHYQVASNSKEYAYEWDDNEYSVNKAPIPAHKIDWYLDKVTYDVTRVFQSKNSGFDKRYNELHCIEFSNEEIVSKDTNINDDTKVEFFSTSHEFYEENSKKDFYRHTFGCVFKCYSNGKLDRSIGYTSDTSMTDSLISKNIKEKLEPCNIVIANISGIYETDVLLEKKKGNHLGYYGCYEIIQHLLEKHSDVLKYYLISEFSNIVTDIRFDISKYLQDEVNKLTNTLGINESPLIVPTENGLIIDLDSLKIQCMFCHDFSDKIQILRPIGENQGLKYICNKCMYSNR